MGCNSNNCSTFNCRCGAQAAQMPSPAFSDMQALAVQNTFDSKPTPTPQIASPKMTLPIDSKERKDYPIHRGVVRYFPAALAGVAKTSKLGNDKHNPGEEMHHARGKSPDHGDCVIRHLMDAEDLLAAYQRDKTASTPEEILNEFNQMAWRALALSQAAHEFFGAPLAPGANK